jgi:hypothetical protein
MRHLFGVVLAMLMGAALFLVAGWGIAEITSLHSRDMILTTTPGLAAVAAMLGVGLLLGVLLAVPGISPVGTGLPGLLLLGWSALLVVSARRATRLIPLPGHSFADGFGSMLTSGALALVGAAMVVPLFVPSRWRRRYAEDDYADEPSQIGLMRLAAAPASGAGPRGATARARHPQAAASAPPRTARPRWTRPARSSRTAG